MNGLRTRNALTFLIGGITAACFAGCSVTPPVTKIHFALHPPAGAEVETTSAYQLVRWNVGDQRLALSPRGSLDDMLDLWLSIENQGEDAVDFFPSHIEYSYCRPAGTTAKPVSPESNDPICTPFASVPTREQAAAHLAAREQKRQEADNADEAAMAAVVILFVFAIIVVAAAASSDGGKSSSGGSSRTVGHHGRSHCFVPLRMFANAATQVNYAPSYHDAPATVPPEAFLGGNLQYTMAESVIRAGERHAGHIFIPPYKNASLLRLRIGIGSNTTTVQFDYHPQKDRPSVQQGRAGM
ncbi:MAG: hypothetical protein SF187_22150 [Deltaproteobacteria bacterium]|nr:hypothetical protein [Deltaproteobacteria bacterium]